MNVSARNRRSGFTLIEMVMVIMVISILAIVVINQLPTASLNLAAEAQKGLDNIRYTQALAMYKGQNYYLIVLSSNSYEIVSASGTPVVLAQGNTIVTFPSGATFSSTTFTNGVIGFNSRGEPLTDTSGTLLSTVGTLNFTYGTVTMQITIQPETGRLTLS